MRNRRLIIMICITALISLTAGCSVLGGGGSSDDASQTSVTDSDDISSDSSDNPFSTPADDTSVADDDSSDDDTVVADDTDTSDDDAVSVDEISIDGDAEASFSVGDGFSELFTASPAETGLSYTWEVEGKPDWVIKAEDGSYNQRLTLSADSIPADASGQDFEMTIKAKEETSGKESSFVFTVKVAEVVIDIPEPVEDPCNEPLSIKIKSLKTQDVLTESNSVLDCVGDWDCHVLDGDLDSDREATFEITGGMAPYFVTVHSEIDNGFHCRRKNSVGTILDYQMENSYFFADNESECKDKDGNALPSIVTSNKTWYIDDAVQGECVDCSAGTAWSTDSKNFTIKGRLRYEGPLPISLLPKGDYGYDDARQYKPVEQLTVTVSDSCQPKTVVLDDGHSVTQIRRAVEQLKTNIVYPEEDKIEGLKFRMAYQTTLSIDPPQFDKLKVYLSDEWIDSCGIDKCDNTNPLGVASSTNYDYVDHDNYSCPDPVVGERFCITDPDDVSTLSGYGTDRDQLRNILLIRVFINGVGDDMDVKWMRFEDRYWRAQWTNHWSVVDDYGIDSDQFLLAPWGSEMYNDGNPEMSAPTYLNSNLDEIRDDVADHISANMEEIAKSTTIFKRREVPEYRD